jgi:hypothetical protein
MPDVYYREKYIFCRHEPEVSGERLKHARKRANAPHNRRENELNFSRGTEGMGQKAGMAKLHSYNCEEPRPALRSRRSLYWAIWMPMDDGATRTPAQLFVSNCRPHKRE